MTFIDIAYTISIGSFHIFISYMSPYSLQVGCCAPNSLLQDVEKMNNFMQVKAWILRDSWQNNALSCWH